MTKLKITESQYNRLENLLIEAKFDVVMKKNVKAGDVIRLTYKNTTLNFKVIQSLNGQVIMDNIDSGANKNYRYFINFNSLNGDDLEVKRVHKTKEADKLNDVKNWTRLELKDIKHIEVLRNGGVVDVVDTPSTSNEKQTANAEDTETEIFKDTISDLIVKMATAKQSNGIFIDMVDGRHVPLCVDANDNGTLTLGMYDISQIRELNDWDRFILKLFYDEAGGDTTLYDKNKNVLSTSDGGKTLTLKLKAITDDKSKDLIIKGIKSINVVPDCEQQIEKPKTSDTNVKTPRLSGNTEDLIDDAKIAYDLILKDPILKQAFYKAPNFWNLFVAELKGKEAKGTGIVPTLDLVDRYMNKKIDEKFGGSFKNNKTATFRLVNKPIYISYEDSGSNKNFEMGVGVDYKAKVEPYILGDNPNVKVLRDAKAGYEIVVKQETDKNNEYVCDITKFGTPDRTVKDVLIKFLPSDGFRP